MNWEQNDNIQVTLQFGA